MQQGKTLLLNANIYNKGLSDILIEDGKILEISDQKLRSVVKDARKVDLNGNLLISPYVESHIHLDYAYTALRSDANNETGTLYEGIDRWSHIKKTDTVQSIKERAEKALKNQILRGVQYVRTHVDITDSRLIGLKALLEIKETYKELVQLQLVAFPQEGMYCYYRAGELLEEALKMGADAVGAIPHFEYTEDLGKASVKKAVNLAIKYNKLIDIHCDETDDANSHFLEQLAYLAYANGIGSMTTASHTSAMGSYNNAYTFRLLRLLCQAGLNVAVCPAENLYLQGRQDSYPKRRGITRVKELMEAGINVSFGQDSISDPWYPLGNGNLMNILDIGLHACQLMSLKEIDKALDLITWNGARTLNLDTYGIKEGNMAEFIILDAKTPFDAVRSRAEVIGSVRNGRLLFKREQPAYRSEYKLSE
ncbi:MAG: cytosine deaminase [Clostridiaceae bacterium]|uniref:Cytosine deaminase n=1 Tax=Clostridium porci TaxID=2605778 RepID=A0A7X2NN24_9CLOT|nr:MULTISPECIES: cytosine deaminase [Clostridium]MCI6138875.1 cytosine deaminase [Clostridium sp.]MDY3230522.1 cytosine deaminase [Clostridiaceae bacterium]MSS37318.1 cytosine deaminase [Clostridium porci]